MRPRDITLGDSVHNAKNMGGEKELMRTMNVSAVMTVPDRGSLYKTTTKFKDLVIVRWYMSRSKGASRVYCSIWAHGSNSSWNGHGWAGGHGYDKYAASFDAACASANINLPEAVTGFSCCRNATKAIAYKIMQRHQSTIAWADLHVIEN